MNVNQITCKHCGEVFDTRGKYNGHYKSKHQKKIKFNNWIEEESHIERSEDGKFTCKCGKKFVRGDNLIIHQKNCNIWNEKETSESESDHGIFKIYIQLIIETSTIVCENELSPSTQTQPSMLLDLNYNLAICSICYIGFPFEWLTTHFKNHGLDITIEKAMEYLNTEIHSMEVQDIES